MAAVTAVALLCAAGLATCRVLFGTVRIAGTSMRDTLESGDIALVARLAYRGGLPVRGDVVECRFPGRVDTYIKRVVGLPGETIAFSGGALTVDGRPVSEPYVSSLTEDFGIRLGADEYLALGDNRAASYDSRMEDMGPVGGADCLGRVIWILWPPERFGPVD